MSGAVKQFLLARLEASSCELCREAAASIRQLQKRHADDLRDAARDARDSYTEGRWDEREQQGNGGW